MERVAIIRPPESSLPLANSAGDRIGRWSHAICPLSTDPGGHFAVLYIFRKGEGLVAYHYQQVQAADRRRRYWKPGLIKNNELHGLISHWYHERSSQFIITPCQISNISVNHWGPSDPGKHLSWAWSHLLELPQKCENIAPQCDPQIEYLVVFVSFIFLLYCWQLKSEAMQGWYLQNNSHGTLKDNWGTNTIISAI